jgi:proteasome alpha subunit
MQNSQQQAYDRGITIFSPDGRLYQVEYAREAVKRGTAAVGIRTPEGVVLAADGRLRSELQVAESVEKIHKADDHLGVATAGHAADARRLVDMARRRAQVEKLRYGEAIDTETLTKAITDNIQEFTQTGGARPFGCALLIAGVDDGGEPRLFETDPSGTPYEWKAVAVGGNQREAQDTLEEGYDELETVDDGLRLAFEALAATADGDLTPEGMSAATIDAETATFEALERSEIADHLDEHGLLGEDADRSDGE